MLTVKMAFRNVLRQKRRTVLTGLTMLGGFFLASVSIGWADGTYNGIIDMFTRNRTGHVQVHAKGYLDKPTLHKTIDRLDSVVAAIEAVSGVEAWAPRLYAAGLVSVGKKSGAVKVTGMSPSAERRAMKFSDNVERGVMLPDTACGWTLLGTGLASVLNAGPGDSAVIVSQAADGSIANERYYVAGVVESGDPAEDRMAFYLHLEDARELFVLNGRVHEIAVIAQNTGHARRLARRIAQRIDNPSVSVQSWQEFAGSFYSAMQADKQGMYIFLFIIILIVAVGVLNTVLMSVLERRREYGLLKALGSRPLHVFRLILIETNVLALLSIAAGALLGLLGNYILSIHGFTLPEPITYGGMEFRTMRAEINARSLYIPALTVLVVATVVSTFPALRAAHTDPAETMRAQ